MFSSLRKKAGSLQIWGRWAHSCVAVDMRTIALTFERQPLATSFQTLVDMALARAEPELSNAASTTAWELRSGKWLACKSELESLQELVADPLDAQCSHRLSYHTCLKRSGCWLAA